MFENDESPGEPFTLIFGHNHIIGKIGNEKIVNRKTGEELSFGWDDGWVIIERKRNFQNKK